MGCLGLLVLIVISLPVILLVTTLIGSMINIPISRQRMVRKPSQPRFVRFFFYVPPQVRYQVITVNVGGAVVPVCFALYLLPQAAMMSTAVITVVVALVTKWLAKTVPGLGIVMPFWAPPLLSAGLARTRCLYLGGAGHAHRCRFAQLAELQKAWCSRYQYRGSRGF